MKTPTHDTFFGAPRSEQPAAGKAALIGVPFDTLATERRGSAEGPAALRRATRNVGTYRVSTGRTMDWAERLVDLGDVEVNRFDPHSSFEPVRQIVQEAVEVGAIPLCIGGDHSLTYAALTAVAKVHDGLRLIQIDAHHDATNPAQWNCRYNHGTFVRNLIEDGVLAGPDVLQLAVRDFQWTDSGAHFLAEHEAYCRAMSQIDDHGLDDMLTMIRAEADRPTYITFDIDSVDPAYAPGTGEHMPGGLSAREAAALVRSLFDGSIRIVGADLVEVAPGLDPTGRTVALAANLLGLMADGLAGPEKSAIHSRKVETARGRAT